MGKLLDRLNKQLETEYKKDAEDCLKIYNYLKGSTGHVWESTWRPLVYVTFPNGKKTFKPTSIGYLLLKALGHDNRTEV